MLGSGCGGVTADAAAASFEARAGTRTLRSPSAESSWLKRECGRSPDEGTPPPSSSDEECEICESIAYEIFSALGSRRRGEAEVRYLHACHLTDSPLNLPPLAVFHSSAPLVDPYYNVLAPRLALVLDPHTYSTPFGRTRREHLTTRARAGGGGGRRRL
eukprot:6211741-Pleurochrysis_carterae.AAC.6